MGGTRAHTEEVMRRAAEPVALALGVDLEGLEVRPAGRRDLVRVIVDQDGGVDLDRVAEVSVALSAALDDSAEVAAALAERSYVLEVSSPGVDRPLTQPRHWRRAQGRLVSAYLRDGSVHTGRVTVFDEETGWVDVGDRRLALVDLERGEVQVEFTSAEQD